MNRSSQKRMQGFTLIELLVVIVIISIILGITAPAFRSIANGSAVDGAARMLSSQFMLARAEAIARRKCVAVIMPASGLAIPSDDTNVYNRQAFRSAYVTGEGPEFSFDSWVPGTEWSFLPTGAVIGIVENGTYSTLSFDSEESAYIPKNDYDISDGSGIPCVSDTATAKMFSSSNSQVRAIVFKPNGRAAFKSYVTVMEGLCEDNSSGVERANKSNIKVMEINQFTGQVRYLF